MQSPRPDPLERVVAMSDSGDCGLGAGKFSEGTCHPPRQHPLTKADKTVIKVCPGPRLILRKLRMFATAMPKTHGFTTSKCRAGVQSGLVRYWLISFPVLGARRARIISDYSDGYGGEYSIHQREAAMINLAFPTPVQQRRRYGRRQVSGDSRVLRLASACGDRDAHAFGPGPEAGNRCRGRP